MPTPPVAPVTPAVPAAATAITDAPQVAPAEPAATVEPQVAPAADPSPAHDPQPAPTPSPAPARPPGIPVKSPLGGISGRSLADIMSGPAESEQREEKEETATPADPEAQEKIERMREKFIGKLCQERPRIGVVFETMEVEGNTVRVKVASHTLHDEVMRHRTETLHLLAAVAGIYGPLELDVTIDETMKAAKPIRIEDKVKYMSDRNPSFNDLRRTLEMEIE